MDELTTKFGKQHTKLINNAIIREINKQQSGTTKSAKLSVSTFLLILFKAQTIEAAVIERLRQKPSFPISQRVSPVKSFSQFPKLLQTPLLSPRQMNTSHVTPV